MRKKSFIAVFFALSIFGSTVSSSALAAEPVQQVKLSNFLGNQNSIGLKIHGKYLLDTATDTDYFLKEGTDYQVKINSSSVCLYEGQTALNCSTDLTISPVSYSNYAYLNNIAYNGQIKFTNEGGYVRPINSVFMEDYVKGVLPKEIYPSWPLEALKAQAVAARTYAFKRNSVLTDTIMNQVYGGYFWAPELDVKGDYTTARNAVDGTIGSYLTYNGRTIDAVFSSSNGGYTETNSAVWGSDPLPYFPAKDDSQFDGINSDILWSIPINKKQIDTSSLNLTQPDLWWGNVKEKEYTFATNIKALLDPAQYDPTKIKIVNITDLSVGSFTTGKRFTKGSLSIEYFNKDKKDANNALAIQKLTLTDLSAPQIRSIFGANLMKSYLVKEIVKTTDTITINGAGFGHGVGLSQFGAMNRAKGGQPYNQILSFYYPGTTLSKDYSSLSDHHSLEAVLNGWILDGSSRYYFTSGKTYSGWKEVDNTWYLFDASGKALTGWQYVGGKWYFMNGQGKMLTGWVYSGGQWYLLNSSGQMLTGWQQDNGSWYFLKSDGSMAKGWVSSGGKRYFMNSQGKMLTGWVYDNSKWYFMNKSGAMQTGWIYDGGKWYYLGKDGVWVKDAKK